MEASSPNRGPKGHHSIAYVRDHWYVACRSHELKDTPLARTILGTSIVLFRAEGERLVCGYHGWEYDGAGVCQRVPALCGPQTGKARRVPSFATVERQGFVWVYANADVTPKVEPYSFPKLDEPRYGTVFYESE